MDIESAKRRVCSEVDRISSDLLDVSHKIHANPELCFEEHFAHDLLTGILADRDMNVKRHAYGLDTAFEACVGDETGTNVAVICEYDGLPDMGHGCGHNVIAAAGLGAGLAAATIASEAGGRVTVVGTPAEEGGGGKEIMLQRGAFADVDAAIMMHPSNEEIDDCKSLAIFQLEAEYHGKPAHASSEPYAGRNALDAAVLGYNAVAALRQHIRENERIHGIFTYAGDLPNIVPASATAEWFIRSPDLKALELLKKRVYSCLKAGADAAGCTVDITPTNPVYAEMISNSALLASYRNNLADLGRALNADIAAPGFLSTDMGNVSQVVPAIHPFMKIAPSEVTLHTPEFADCAVSTSGDAAVLDGAKVMAMTIVDFWLDRATQREAEAEFEARCNNLST